MKKFVRESVTPILIVVILLFSILGLSIFVGAMEKTTNNSNSKRANIIVDINGSGNYASIQDAIDDANPGDSIYVWAGVYYENLLINKGVSLIGNGTLNTIINGSFTGDVVFITANSVKISDFTITYSGIRGQPYDDSGIELNYVSDVHIFKNNVSNNKIGIFLNNSDYNLIEDNLVGWSGDIGICCMNSNYNRLLRNNCSFTFFGLGIIYGGNNSARDNICISNSWSGILISDTRDNYVARNKCLNGNSGFEIWFSTNNDITNNSVKGNSFCGIALGYAQKNIIQNNSIERNDYAGLRMEDSNFNSITKNNISNNLYGVYINILSYNVKY